MLQIADCSLRELKRAVSQKSDGIQTHVVEARVVVIRPREGNQAFDAVGECRRLRFGDVLEILPDNLLDDLERKLDNAARLIVRRCLEYVEERLPARLDVPDVAQHHLPDAADDELAHVVTLAVFHDDDEWL